MGRNKLIYALADLTIVVSAEVNKGGTWAGATEALKNQYSQHIFARVDSNVSQANHQLLSLGARPWQGVAKGNELNERIRDAKHVETSPQNVSLFAQQGKSSDNSHRDTENPIYQSVLPIMLASLANEPDIFRLSEKLQVTTEQLIYWLKLAMDDGLVSNDTDDGGYYVIQKQAM